MFKSKVEQSSPPVSSPQTMASPREETRVEMFLSLVNQHDGLQKVRTWRDDTSNLLERTVSRGAVEALRASLLGRRAGVEEKSAAARLASLLRETQGHPRLMDVVCAVARGTGGSDAGLSQAVQTKLYGCLQPSDTYVPGGTSTSPPRSRQAHPEKPSLTTKLTHLMRGGLLRHLVPESRAPEGSPPPGFDPRSGGSTE